MGGSSALAERWPIVVCIVEVALVIFAALGLLWRHESFGRRSRWDASAMEVSVATSEDADFVAADEVWSACAGSVHPAWLFAFRAFAFFYFLPLLIFDVVTHGVFAYRFYTQWTFTLMVAYFGLVMLASCKQVLCCGKRTSCANDLQTVSLISSRVEDPCHSGAAFIENSEPENAGCFGYLVQILFQVCTPSVMLTDAVYWLVLVPFVIPSGFHNNFLNINVHAVNAGFMLLEYMFNSMPFPWFRIGYFMLWSIIYTLFLWIMHAIGFRWWPYPFLDVSTPSAPIWYFGLAVLHLIAFGICSFFGFIKYHLCCSRSRRAKR